jgi:hypothetical protein
MTTLRTPVNPPLTTIERAARDATDERADQATAERLRTIALTPVAATERAAAAQPSWAAPAPDGTGRTHHRHPSPPRAAASTTNLINPATAEPPHTTEPAATAHPDRAGRAAAARERRLQEAR